MRVFFDLTKSVVLHAVSVKFVPISRRQMNNSMSKSLPAAFVTCLEGKIKMYLRHVLSPDDDDIECACKEETIESEHINNMEDFPLHTHECACTDVTGKRQED